MRRTLTGDAILGRRRLLAALATIGLAAGAMVAGFGPVTAQAAPAEKVQVCHYNPYVGAWQVNTIKDNGKALQAHLDHGDAQPGDPVPGMEGHTFDETCTPVAEETIFAVAYTDVNIADGGYNPAVDVLIAKAVDTNGSGVPDRVVTNKYPLNFNPTSDSDYANTQVSEHTIIRSGQPGVSGACNFIVREPQPGFSNPDAFGFRNVATSYGREEIFLDASPANGGSSLRDNRVVPNAPVSLDGVVVDPLSLGQPDVLAAVSLLRISPAADADDAFLDVEVYSCPTWSAAG